MKWLLLVLLVQNSSPYNNLCEYSSKDKKNKNKKKIHSFQLNKRKLLPWIWLYIPFILFYFVFLLLCALDSFQSSSSSLVLNFIFSHTPKALYWMNSFDCYYYCNYSIVFCTSRIVLTLNIFFCYFGFR